MKLKTKQLIGNSFVIETNRNSYLQSYNVIVVRINSRGDVFLDKNYWRYSVTTSKHRNKFLGENTRETERKIRNNIYKLVNLN